MSVENINEDNDLDLDLDLDNEDDLDDDYQDEENDNNFEQEVVEPRKNKGGRPKGSTKIKSLNSIASITDPFQYAEAFLLENPTEPIVMKIRRGGALVAEVDYSNDRSKMKFLSLSNIQKNLGAGLYSFEIISLKTRRTIREPFTENLLPHIDLLNMNEINKAAQEEKATNDNNNLISALNGLRTPERPIDPARPPTLIEQVIQLAPLFPMFKDLITALRPPVVAPQVVPPQASPEELLLKVQMLMKQQEDEAEKKQLKIEQEVERRLAKAKEENGIKPDKSLIEQAFEGIANISKTVETNAKIKAMELNHKRQAMLSKVPVQRIAPRPIPPKLSPSGQIIDTTLETIKTEVSDLTSGVQQVIVKFSEFGGDELKVSEHIKATPSLLELINKYDIDTICKEACRLLELKEEPEILRQGIVNLYANCKNEQV